MATIKRSLKLSSTWVRVRRRNVLTSAITSCCRMPPSGVDRQVNNATPSFRLLQLSSPCSQCPEKVTKKDSNGKEKWIPVMTNQHAEKNQGVFCTILFKDWRSDL